MPYLEIRISCWWALLTWNSKQQPYNLFEYPWQLSYNSLANTWKTLAQRWLWSFAWAMSTVFFRTCKNPVLLLGCFECTVFIFLSHVFLLTLCLPSQAWVKACVWKHGAFHLSHLLSFTPFLQILSLCLLTTSSHLSLFPPLFSLPSFATHTGKSDWFTAGPATALWRFLPFLHFVAFAEMVICHCACAARHAALHRLVRARTRELIDPIWECH